MCVFNYKLLLQYFNLYIALHSYRTGLKHHSQFCLLKDVLYLMFVKSLLLYVCALTDVNVPRHTHGGQRTTCKSLLSSSTAWVLATELRFSGLVAGSAISLSLNCPWFSKPCPATLRVSCAETVEVWSQVRTCVVWLLVTTDGAVPSHGTLCLPVIVDEA